jgi:CheY-like chemotaxis protein
MPFQKEADPVLKKRAATDYITPSPRPCDLTWEYRELSAPKKKRGLIVMTRFRILLVDDDDDEILLTRKMLESENCEVVSANSVIEALKQIAAQRFDVLITDLHMPDPGDGFTIVTAMRHFQPEVLTLVVSDYPDAPKAMAAVLLQADEVLVRPFDVEQLTLLMSKRKVISGASPRLAKENVPAILDRDSAITIQQWLRRVEQVDELTSLPLAAKERTEYLPEIIRNITARLRTVRTVDVIDRTSPAAVAHGQLRYRQGYTAP